LHGIDRDLEEGQLVALEGDTVRQDDVA